MFRGNAREEVPFCQAAMVAAAGGILGVAAVMLVKEFRRREEQRVLARSGQAPSRQHIRFGSGD